MRYLIETVPGMMCRLALFFILSVIFNVHANAGVFMYHASQELSYDDNIYLTPENEKGSVIITPKVGGEYSGQLPESTITGNVNGTAGYHYYSYRPERNSYPDVLAQAHFRNYFFELGDRYVFTSDPVSHEITERAKRYKNLVYFTLRTNPIFPIGFGVKGENTVDYYMSTPFQFLRRFNRNCLSFYGLMYYNFSPLTNLYFEYGQHKRRYYLNSDNDSTGASFALGLEGYVSPVIEANAKISYAFRGYNFEVPEAVNDVNTVGFHLSLDWKPRSKNEVRITAQRYLEETVYGENRFFTAFDTTIYASHKFTDKYFVSLMVDYHILDYAKVVGGIQRYDTLYSIRPEFGYQFKDWLSAGVWYRHTRRKSTLWEAVYLDRTLSFYINIRR